MYMASASLISRSFAGDATPSLHIRAAGVIFVEENGEGPGVRLRKGRPEC
jgi:hypothetical protein